MSHLNNRNKRNEVYDIIEGELQFQFKNWKKERPEKDSIPTWLERMEKHFKLAKAAHEAGNEDEVMSEIRILSAIGTGAMVTNPTPQRK